MLKAILLMLSLLTPVYAVASNNTSRSEQSSNTIVVHVKGMVCDFCAQSINKVFLKEPGVAAVDINLTTKLVTIRLKPRQNISNEKINELIEWAGYEVKSIQR